VVVFVHAKVQRWGRGGGLMCGIGTRNGPPLGTGARGGGGRGRGRGRGRGSAASTGWSIDQRRGAAREAGRVLAIGLAIGSAAVHQPGLDHLGICQCQLQAPLEPPTRAERSPFLSPQKSRGTCLCDLLPSSYSRATGSKFTAYGGEPKIGEKELGFPNCLSNFHAEHHPRSRTRLWGMVRPE